MWTDFWWDDAAVEDDDEDDDDDDDDVDAVDLLPPFAVEDANLLFDDDFLLLDADCTDDDGFACGILLVESISFSEFESDKCVSVETGL